jgi:hypothetical protein
VVHSAWGSTKTFPLDDEWKRLKFVY